MDKREKALKAKKERLTNYLLNQMLITETKQIKCPHFVISLRDNQFSVKVELLMQFCLMLCCCQPNHANPTNALLKIYSKRSTD